MSLNWRRNKAKPSEQKDGLDANEFKIEELELEAV